MTAVTLPAFAPAPTLPRLVAIELRKTVDTRAGFWLLAASALLAIVVVGLTLAFGHATDLMALHCGHHVSERSVRVHRDGWLRHARLDGLIQRVLARRRQHTAHNIAVSDDAD